MNLVPDQSQVLLFQMFNKNYVEFDEKDALHSCHVLLSDM
jgi:hypothetical protein